MFFCCFRDDDLGFRIWDLGFFNPRSQIQIAIAPFMAEKFTGKFSKI
jgi:hypothetical protein